MMIMHADNDAGCWLIMMTCVLMMIM